MKYLFMGLIRLYQWTISPFLGPRCKYWPSCSRYGYEAFARHGTIRGFGLTAWRIMRCNPWSHGGIDPVPAERRRGRWHVLGRDDDRGCRPTAEDRGSRGGTVPPARPRWWAGRFGPSTTGSTMTPSAPADVARPQGATE